jgi:hypothetical protein
MRVLRLAVVALVAALAAAIATEHARSALFFAFSPTAAKPGETIAIRTPQTPWRFDVRAEGARPLQHPIPLYLVSNSIAKDVSSHDDPRLHYIGSILLDRNGRGVLRFTVPDLRSGRYAVAGVCIQCAPYSRGSTFFVLPVDERNIAPKWRPVMLLRVEATSADTLAKEDGETPLSLWALAALFGALAAGLVAWARRRSATRRVVRPE